MKATVSSTTEVVEIVDIKGNRCLARVWEGVSEKGIFVHPEIADVLGLDSGEPEG